MSGRPWGDVSINADATVRAMVARRRSWVHLLGARRSRGFENMSKKTQSGQRKSLLTGASVLAAAAAAIAATPAMAQDAEDEEAIVVTGTRLVRQDFEAISPITTVRCSQVGVGHGSEYRAIITSEMTKGAIGAMKRNKGRSNRPVRLGATR